MSFLRLTKTNTSYEPATVVVVGVVFLSECFGFAKRLVKKTFSHIFETSILTEDMYRSTRTEQCPFGAV